MTRIAAVVLALASGVPAQTTDTRQLLTRVEQRYNRAKTLQVSFEETYGVQGRGQKTEAGNLTLRKPGRMRWDYTRPAGKLFLSDGKNIFYYNPLLKRAERMKLKETDDMRAPLAFLLGRLDFDRDFRNFRTKPEGDATWITADPKTDRVPYREVAFLVGPGAEIRRMRVTGQDSSVLSFAFTGEKMNPPVEDKLFRFELPPGATYIDAGAGEEGSAR